MKSALVFLLVCLTGAFAANHQLLRLIDNEVKSLLHTDPNLTVDQCTTKCDALFDLVAGHDEKITDQMCHTACKCEITPNSCPFSTHAPHQSTHAHRTRHPTTVAPLTA